MLRIETGVFNMILFRLQNKSWFFCDDYQKTFDKGNNGEFKVDLTDFSKGVYFLNFVTGNQNLSVKVLKQ